MKAKGEAKSGFTIDMYYVTTYVLGYRPRWRSLTRMRAEEEEVWLSTIEEKKLLPISVTRCLKVLLFCAAERTNGRLIQEKDPGNRLFILLLFSLI